jgi:5'-nucleotidase
MVLEAPFTAPGDNWGEAPEFKLSRVESDSGFDGMIDMWLRGTVVGLVALVLVAGPAEAKVKRRIPATVDVAVFAINDFHGNLKSADTGASIPGAGDALKSVPVGGIEYMATLVHQLRAKHRNSIVVGAGDLIGASPLLSGLFHDEPSVEALGKMGLEVTSVGNHEFDEGTTELLRMKNGGCHPVDGCEGPHKFAGAKYHYLSANVVDKSSGKPIFPPYYVKRFGGIPVAFIGMTLQGTGFIVAPAGVATVRFEDEANTVNALVPELHEKGIEAIVVLIHQGGGEMTSGGYNDCKDFAGPIVDLVKKFDKAVDVVVSGHTHQAYNCIIDGRLVTSAHRYGTMVTEIDLKLSRKTHDVAMAKAQNVIVNDNVLAKDPAETKLLLAYEKIAAPIEYAVEGTAMALFSAVPNAAGESQLGDLIADAQLEAAKDAQIGFMNAGGIRSDLKQGRVTYASLFSVQPFGNALVTMDLPGAQLKQVLEQQWYGPQRIMPVSKGFAYTWDATGPMDGRVKSMTLNGAPIDPAATYRVVLSNYLAGGGDGMTVFKSGANRKDTGIVDVDALAAYVKAASTVTPPALDRITRAN